ncbi:hypothetical protein [Mycoplasmopsis pullorum]|uniref:hypothetical protein n=1 Tax=Mycoplasmopsis pullorum TaxID=48003 RepID=UPI001118A3E1|nr:hypothetical protein [Mycoplasmopsis pullorum]
MKNLSLWFKPELYKTNIKLLNFMRVFNFISWLLLFFGLFYLLYLHNIALNIGTIENIKSSGAYYQVIIPLFVLALVSQTTRLTIFAVILWFNKSKSRIFFFSLIFPFDFETKLKSNLTINHNLQNANKIISNQITNNFFISIFVLVTYVVLMVVDAQILKAYFYYVYHKYFWVHAIYLTLIFGYLFLSIHWNDILKIKLLNRKISNPIKLNVIWNPWAIKD